MTARTLLAWIVSAVAIGAPVAAPTVTFVVGPFSPDAARRTAKGAASAARRVLDVSGASVEVRGIGSPDSDTFEGAALSKDIEESLWKAATSSSGSSTTPAQVLTTLDAAAQALSRKPVGRVLVALVEQQPLASDAEQQLANLIVYCQEHGVRVLVVDPSQSKSNAAGAPLQRLAELSGGALLDNPKSIGSQIVTTLATPSHGQSAPGSAAESQSAASSNLPPLPADLPVYVRFLQTGSGRSRSWGIERRSTGGGGPGGGGITTVEGGANIDSVNGPTHGLLLVQAPMSRLEFQIDDNSGTYTAKARVTQIVRETSGREVWRASKDVVIKGPLAKLKTRQSGNVVYLRDVTLPGGRYLIEGTVEDLLAHKTGGVREPLSTAAGLPGFNVSDALIVRPFTAATDRFEADQVMSYDGDALSPLLSPVFEAEKPVTLQIFLTLYPDINGSQPQLSLELLQSGQVVGRLALPFTDRLKDTSREGIGAISGEQKHQFPYLATIRGVKLARGEYEARVIVRQDRNVLSRSVRFRVEGDSASAAPRVLNAGVAGTAPDSAPAEEDLSSVVLPPIDTADLNTSGPSLPPDEVARLWEESALHARDFSTHLPNFRCVKETRRLTAPVRKSDLFKEADLVVAELTYENGHESRQVISVNGLKTGSSQRSNEGVLSRGEFGTLLNGIFSTRVAAKYKWAGRAMTGGSLCRVFDVEVPSEHSNFILTHNDDQVVAAYKGRVYIDEETSLIRRITIEGVNLPGKFGLQSPALSLDYGLVKIGDTDYLLPLRSVLQTRRGKVVVRNETVFRDYHKFDAKSSIVY